MKTFKPILCILILLIHFSLSAQRKLTTGTIHLNLNQVHHSGQYIDIPVTFDSPDTIIALDLAMRFTEGVLQYESLVNSASYLTDILGYFSPDTKTLKITSNSNQNYLLNQTIFSIRFKMLSTKVNATDLFELVGYLNGDRVPLQLNGNFSLRQSSLNFWFDNSPIRYNVNDPDFYLITDIFGAAATCALTISTAIQPDTNGNFLFNTQNAPYVKILRDILPTTNVQTVINDLDVSLAHKIILKDPAFLPSVYQLIALDVNADGIISAGDISQINQRSAGNIPEFKQKWNYNIFGSSNGYASKDWLFVDSVALAQSNYQISAIYPLNDGIGYSQAKVPIVQFCLEAPTNTASVSGSTYTGILLGDINGNYSEISRDGRIKRIAMLPKKYRGRSYKKV